MSLATTWNAARKFGLQAGIAASMALAGNGLTSKSALAETTPVTPTAVPVNPTQKRNPLLNQKECLLLTSVASSTFKETGVVREKIKYNPEFPETLASFIAPNNTKIVFDIIVDGTFDLLAKDKSPEAIAKKKALVSSATCSGEPIVVVKGYGTAMYNTLRTFLLEATPPISLHNKGLVAISPEEYAISMRARARPENPKGNAGEKP